ncbi:HNH endonuclease [Bacillus subtilis]|nr:HNH endonuclease [Bacillus subtilis]MED3693404.1 HNH endonuclease [Bacillus subtilis]
MPIASYREKIIDYYDARVKKVEQLNDVTTFSIYNQNGALDADRFYIGSKDEIWELMRTICLPKITTLYIHKLINIDDESDIKYFFELFITSKSKNRYLPSMAKAIKETEKAIINDTNIDKTDKETLIKARKGQGKFRKNTLSIMPCCPFTNVSEPSLLRSSHIKPWAHCLSNEERLSGYNGLSLTPTYDVLFDKGLISFEDNGKLIISEHLPDELINAFNLQRDNIYYIANDTGLKNSFLAYHREHILV